METSLEQIRKQIEERKQQHEWDAQSCWDNDDKKGLDEYALRSEELQHILTLFPKEK